LTTQLLNKAIFWICTKHQTCCQVPPTG